MYTVLNAEIRVIRDKNVIFNYINILWQIAHLFSEV
jgi:hypothetical protein